MAEGLVLGNFDALGPRKALVMQPRSTGHAAAQVGAMVQVQLKPMPSLGW